MEAIVKIFLYLVVGLSIVSTYRFMRNPLISKPAKITIAILTIGLGACFFMAAGARAESKYPYMPNPQLTPGVSASTNVVEVCEPGYPERSRHVTASTIKKVYNIYGVDKKQCVGGCKIDHLIPLSIGGSNDIHNLWPHEYGADRNVFSKTRLEVRLRKEVCAGRIDIVEAQQCIATDWPKCFDRFYPGVYKHE